MIFETFRRNWHFDGRDVMLRGTERGHNWESTDAIQITAVGLSGILARKVDKESREEWMSEGSWVLYCRDWQKIARAPLDDTPPRKEWIECPD